MVVVERDIARCSEASMKHQRRSSPGRMACTDCRPQIRRRTPVAWPYDDLDLLSLGLRNVPRFPVRSRGDH
jgi:hypothetical protein